MNKVKAKDFIKNFHRAEPSAMNAIYNEYYSSVCSFIYKKIGDIDHSEDIGITTFTKCFISCASFENLDHVRNFLYKTAHNACIDHLRFIERRMIAEKDIEYLAEKVDVNIQHEMILNEMTEIVKAEIEALPKKTGQVISLILDGKKPKEISEQLNMTTDSIKFHRSSAIKLIKHSLIKKNIIYLFLTLQIIHRILS